MTPSRSVRIAAAIAGLAIATGAVAASQATAATKNTTIYACKAKKGGAVRVVTAKAKCGKTATKISWNTAGPAGPTSPSILGFTQNGGVTLQPGAGWVTLGTATFTALSAFRYSPTQYVERYSVTCPGSVDGASSTAMNIIFRYLVNGVQIPDNLNEDGTRKDDPASQAFLLQSWTGPVTLTVLARTTTAYSYGTPAIPTCPLTTGTAQVMAFAYSM